MNSAGDAEPTEQQAAQNQAQYGAEQAEMGEAGKKNRPEKPGDSEQLLSVQVAGGGFEPPSAFCISN